MGSAEGDPFVPKKIGGSVKTTIGPAGGKVKSVDGHLTLEIPAGALADPREIEVQQIEVDGGFGWSLRPNGTTFAVPAKVSLTFSAAEAGARDVGAEGTSAAESVPAVTLLHLSDPAAATDGPILLTGGWDPGGSQVLLTGELAHFSELVAKQNGRYRFVYPKSAAVGERRSSRSASSTMLRSRCARSICAARPGIVS